MRFRAKNETNPEMVRAAEVATRLMNLPEVRAQVQEGVKNEVMRQLGYGLPPSGGMPDMRPNYPRYEPLDKLLEADLTE